MALEALLPDATAIGDGWTKDKEDSSSSTDSSESDKQLEEKCPELAKVLPDDNTDSEVRASYTGPQDRTLELSLNTESTPLTKDNVTKITDALNAWTGFVPATDAQTYLNGQANSTYTTKTVPAPAGDKPAGGGYIIE